MIFCYTNELFVQVTYCKIAEIRKNVLYSRYRISTRFYPKRFKISAFESPLPTFCIFATHEHLRTLHEHLWIHVISIENSVILRDFEAIWRRKFSYLLAKCSWMLVSLQVAKYSSRAFKRTNFEVFWSISCWDIILWKYIEESIFVIFAGDNFGFVSSCILFELKS